MLEIKAQVQHCRFYLRKRLCWQSEVVACLCNPATLETGVGGWYEIGSPAMPCLMSIGCPLEVRCQYGCLCGGTGDQVGSKER